MSQGTSTVADMDIILVPGLWLDASTWDEVIPELERAGHVAHPLTLRLTAPAGQQEAGQRDVLG